MEAADDRDAEDIEFASQVGEQFADRYLVPRLGVWSFFRKKPLARDVTQAALSEVTRYQAYRSRERRPPEFDLPAVHRYETAVGSAIRTMSLSWRLGGVPVLATEPGDLYPGLTVVDVFHPAAIRSLMRQRNAGILAGIESSMPTPDSREWPGVLRKVLPGLGGVNLVDERQAARGFMTSLMFNLRGFLKAREEQPSETPCGGDYTVTCTDGYVLEVFEEFRYAPTVFGNRKSSPVTDHLDCGYFRFQASKGDECIVDRGRHVNKPDKRSTILKDV